MNMMQHTQRQRGFTLIELMIVIAIIAILVAIAIPQYQNYVGRAQMAEALNLTGGLKTTVAEYWTRHGTCPSNDTSGGATATGGLAAPGDIAGQYVDKVVVNADCTIVATMKASDVASAIQGKTLTLTAFNGDPADGDPLSSVTSTTPAKGSIGWACTSNAEQRYLPGSCTHA